jgi:hypothetical protein
MMIFFPLCPDYKNVIGSGCKDELLVPGNEERQINLQSIALTTEKW